MPKRMPCPSSYWGQLKTGTEASSGDCEVGPGILHSAVAHLLCNQLLEGDKNYSFYSNKILVGTKSITRNSFRNVNSDRSELCR